MAVISGVSASIHKQTAAASTATTGESMTQVGTSLWYKGPAAKIPWDKDSTVTIYDDGDAITTVQEINYASGYVRLLTAPTAAVTADFSYFATAEIGGTTKWDLTVDVDTAESAVLGDVARKPYPVSLSWTLSADKHWWDTRATLTTDLAGDDNDLVYTAKQGGDAGEWVSIEYLTGSGKTLGTTVSGDDITVQLGTDGGGTVTSTAAHVRANVLACEDAMRLLDSVEFAAANDGTGLPTVMGHTHLSGGLASDYITSLVAGGDLIIKAYTDDGASLCRYEGLAYLSKASETVKFDTLIEQPIEFTGHGMIYYLEG